MRLLWTRLALSDLDNAYDFIAEDSPGAARRTIERIESASGAIREHPEIGRKGRVAGTRELIVAGSPFILVYRVTPKRVEILTVLHASRRWPDEG